VRISRLQKQQQQRLVQMHCKRMVAVQQQQQMASTMYTLLLQPRVRA
jgi:hypothetical protein